MSNETRINVAFDLYGTLVDPIGIAAEVDRVVSGGRGDDLARLWRSKQLEYSFRMTAMGQYWDFGWITERALGFAVASTGVDVTSEATKHLIECYDRLPPFPDALPALRTLAADSQRVAVFSNGSPDMIERSLENSGLGEYVRTKVSVDDVRAFKPSPVTYRHAADVLGVPAHDVVLVSCNSFDIVGAAAVGLRTVWVNRSGSTFDTIGDQPEATVTNLAELPAVLRTW
ncbi:haloacid dehalogenase type II [Amycolatopsis sp. NPDC051903]|uniref:haloacid dehalogenase type II n=1 Tax=Amycolatopsis sp. NPDC051903 TaxID=3363936 RepID=UPI0037A276F6